MSTRGSMHGVLRQADMVTASWPVTVTASSPGSSGADGRLDQAVGFLIIGGIAVWGFVAGWSTGGFDTGGIATAIGAVLGAAGGVYLIVQPARRLTLEGFR